MMNNNSKMNHKIIVSQALTAFTIATTFASIFVPAYLLGSNQSLISEHSRLIKERELLVERRNKELSIISCLKTPESVYEMALLQDLDLQMASND